MSNPRPGRLVTLALAVLVAGGACSALGGGGALHRVGSAPYDKGSGTVANEARTVAPFRAVSAAQGVTVFLTRGPTAVKVTADDNLLGHVTTEVHDGTLYVAIAGSVETNHELRADVAAPAVDAIRADTGATLDTEDLQGEGLQAAAGTGSTVRAGGRAATLDVTASTGSTVDLRNVEATSASVNVSLGSTAFVNVRDAVSGSCSGGSTLHVAGGATTSAVSADSSSTVARD